MAGDLNVTGLFALFLIGNDLCFFLLKKRIIKHYEKRLL